MVKKIKTPEMSEDSGTQASMVQSRKETLTQYWQERDTWLVSDRNVINLERPEKIAGQSNWITNEPKVFFDLSRSLVSINTPQFRLPIIMNAEQGEKDKMNKAERLAIGIMRNLNDQTVEKGGINWLWDLAYHVLLGWFAVFSVVEDSYEGVRFSADILDPLTVFPLWDSYGLAECVRYYQTDTITATAMMESFIAKGIESEDLKAPATQNGQVDIISYWKRTLPPGKGKPVVQNAIVVGGQLAKPFTHQTKMMRIPIHIGAIGTPDRASPLWMKHKGESIITANRDVYEYLNKMLQLMAETAEQNTYPNRIWKLRNPNQTLPKVAGHGEDVRLRESEAVELLRTATTPEEIAILANYFGKQAQKGSVADMTYGGSPTELSGFAISQLLAAVKYKLGMYLNGMNAITGRVMSDFLYQYRMGNYGDITLSTENPHDIHRGMAYLEEYTKKDIPERIYVECSIPISSQFDKTQAILNAVQAKNSRILSRETIWENEDLGVQDKELEKRRIRDDEVDEDPFFRDVEIVESMRKREKYYREEIGDIPLADAMKNYIAMKEGQMSINRGNGQKPGAGVPGVNPMQSPPEASMSPSPDQTRAFQGQPPPSPNRPVNEGRRGVLVNPTGDVIL